MKIRKGIFETNSSSTYSLILADKEDKIDQTMAVDKQGVVEIEMGRYGWDFESFHSPSEKASYVATCILDCLSGEEKEKALKILKRVVKKNTGAKKIKIIKTEWGYIDHQSDYFEEQKRWDEILFNEDNLTRFIFSSNSYFETGNDNV